MGIVCGTDGVYARLNDGANAVAELPYTGSVLPRGLLKGAKKDDSTRKFAKARARLG